MAVDFYVAPDGGSEGEVKKVVEAIKKEGYSVEYQTTRADGEYLRNQGIVKPPTKLVYIVNGGQAGQTYGSFALDYSEGMCFTIFAFDNYRTGFKETSVQGLKELKLVSEWDSGSFATNKIAEDIKGHTTCSYQSKYPHVFAFVTDETSAENLGKKIAHGQYTCGEGDATQPNNNNDTATEDEEEWDDKDNFTPHKGKIMEIKPYKEISSISFDKSYDSPTGTGTVEIRYKPKDYYFIYKGVAMKLKLRRSCDAQWNATGLEEPNYDENEKFFKEHIPTDELLEELGLPNYRKQKPMGVSSSDDSSSDTSGDSTSDGSTDFTSGGSSSSGSTSSGSSSSGSSTSSSGTSSSSSDSSSTKFGKRRLSNAYISSLKQDHAMILAKRTSEFDEVTIKRLRRQAIGLRW